MNRHYKPTGKYKMRPVETIQTTQDAQARADQWNFWNNERWKDDCSWERAREYEEDMRDDGKYHLSDYEG
jgi:hypothetical protein